MVIDRQWMEVAEDRSSWTRGIIYLFIYSMWEAYVPNSLQHIRKTKLNKVCYKVKGKV